MAADFQNVYRCNVYLCSPVVLADVLEQNCNPVSENELSFVIGSCTCVLFCFHYKGGRNRIGRRKEWPKKKWEEGEIGGKSREEGEINVEF